MATKSGVQIKAKEVTINGNIAGRNISEHTFFHPQRAESGQTIAIVGLIVVTGMVTTLAILAIFVFAYRG